MTDSKKILIFGANGYLGSNFTDYLKSKSYNVFCADKGMSKKEKFYNIDIRDESDVKKIVETIQPDWIFHFAGISSLDFCEKNIEEANAVNITGTQNIIAAAKATNSKLIFISSDYVFSGDDGNYTEKSITKPKTQYGKAKAICEDKMYQLKDFIICRTSNVYGRGGNFYNFIVSNLSLNRDIHLFNDCLYTPTYIEYFIESLLLICEASYNGIIHVCGDDTITRFDFANEVAINMNCQRHINAISRPVDSLIGNDLSLDNTLCKSFLHNYRPSFRDGIKYSRDLIRYPYFSFDDKRGLIKGILNDVLIKQCNYCETKAGSIRGGHYHKKTTEYFYIIDGVIEVSIGEDKKFIARSGDSFCVQPRQMHLFKIKEDSRWINFLTNNEQDIHT